MADELLNALPDGTRIDRYQILKTIGAGNFGITYLAYDAQLELEVVLKEYFPREYAERDKTGCVRPKNASSERHFFWGLESFTTEARTLARFNNNPNIVTVMLLVEGVNNTTYMVMELIKGSSLTAFYESNAPLKPETFWNIFSDLLNGMEEVHDRGVVHRDISPDNVMVQDGKAILIDFGIARRLDLQSKSGFTAVVKHGFSPPEQYSRTAEQGPYSDIYSLAATAYYLLTGESPPPAAARSAGEELAPIPKTRVEELWPGIIDGIAAGLELRFDKRPQTIAEWRKMCARPAAASAPQPFRLDRRMAVLGGVATAGLLVTGFGAWKLFGGEPIASGTAALEIEWRHFVGPTISVANQDGNPDPYPQIWATQTGAVLAAFMIGSDASDHGLALRIDDKGLVTGQWTCPDPLSRLHAVIPTSDGGALFAGGVGPAESDEIEAYLVRLDADWRAPKWQKRVGKGNITSLVATRDGGAIGGVEEGQRFGNARIVAVASDGAERPGNVISVDPAADSVQKIVGLPNGGYAVLGLRSDSRASEMTGSSGSSLWIAFIDDNLQELGRPRLTGAGVATGWGIAAVGDLVYVTGTTGTKSTDRLLMACFDRAGTKIWARWDYPLEHCSGRCIAVSPSGHLFIGGGAGNPKQPFIGQIGKGGELLWSKTSLAGAGVFGTINAISMREKNIGFANLLINTASESPHIEIVKLKASS